MKTLKKFIGLALCVLMLSAAAMPVPVRAVEYCAEISGTNSGANDYLYYGSTVKSYLVRIDGGYMRFQANAVSGGYLVEYFTDDFVLTKQIAVAEELSVFGGFYTDGTNHFVVSGQNNPDESAEVECFRVTKYDLAWNRLAYCGLYDCDTYAPFHVGSVRIDKLDGTLIVRTCHKMYLRSDGYRHQANYTLLVDIEAMTMTGTTTLAYTSHSFNQFVKTEDGYIITVDHGDAYPRSVYLNVSKQSGNYFGKKISVGVLEIAGDEGNNYTGATVGGFEIAQNTYLTAIASVKQDENYNKTKTKNIYVGVTDKTSGETALKQFTFFEDGETGAATPQLVKLESDRFGLMWMETDVLKYVLIDGNGNSLTEISALSGTTLTDCQPLAVDGKAVWYRYDSNEITFCTLDMQSGSYTEKTVNTGHSFVVSAHDDDNPTECTFYCTKCGKTNTYTTASSISIFWSENKFFFSTQGAAFSFSAGSEYPLYFYNKESDPVNDVVITVAHSKEVTVVGSGSTKSMYFPENGLYAVTFTYRYNPYISRTYKISVGEYIKLGDVNADGEINSIDAALVLKYSAGMADLPENADVNYDSSVNSIDASLILKYSAGLIKEFE